MSEPEPGKIKTYYVPRGTVWSRIAGDSSTQNGMHWDCLLSHDKDPDVLFVQYLPKSEQ